MKQIYTLLLLLLLSTATHAQTIWRVTAVDPMYNSLYQTLTVRITAEIDQTFPNQFAMMYHKQYLQGDTLILRPYYNEVSAGSGFPRKQTIVTDLYIGAYNLGVFFKHLCVTPYSILDLDTNMYPPTHNPPDYCFDMRQVLSAPSLSNDDAISIYPNPAEDYISIAGDVQELSIYSMSGVLQKHVHQPQQKLNIEDLPRGVYLVRLQTMKGILHRRLVKQ